MTNIIQPNSQSMQIPVDAFPGQKTDKSKDMPIKVVDRKGKIPTAREEIPREEIEKATEKLNRLMGIIDKRLEFKVDEKSNRTFVKIIDNKTGEILDEIPSKRALDILSSFTDLIGLMVDKRV